MSRDGAELWVCNCHRGSAATCRIHTQADFDTADKAADISGAPVNTSVRSLGADLIAAERRRQIEAEGWSIEHDREHGSALLIRAGHAYATGNGGWWPFDNGASFKPKGPLRNLVRAGALYQAAADVAAGADQHRERCEGYRDDCAKRIDVLIAEVRAVLNSDA